MAIITMSGDSIKRGILVLESLSILLLIRLILEISNRNRIIDIKAVSIKAFCINFFMEYLPPIAFCSATSRETAMGSPEDIMLMAVKYMGKIS